VLRLSSLLTVLLACIAMAGCQAGSSIAPSSSDASDASDAGSIEVPDLSSDDGAQAESDVEAAGLDSTLADANSDPEFDASRDASGCEVTEQDPAAGSTASDGDQVTITVDCSQVDWSNQEGPQWEAFSDAYTTGFDDGCEALFDQSPNGSLYEDDAEYTAYDCQSENPGDAADASDVPDEVPDDPEGAGTELGQTDGCQSLFEQDGVLSLNYGTDAYTEADCPIGEPARTRATRSKTPTPGTPANDGTAESGRRHCSGAEADGTPISLSVTAGKVKCAGAVALLNEWLRRAPMEGVGSGGVLKLYGWECIGATATEAPKIGSCQRAGTNPAAFTASLARGG
jgi:PASTA domain